MAMAPNAILISGGKTTVPQLFIHLGTGRIGLVGMWDVVAFDEVAGLEFSDSTVIQIMKDYMESGSFARGKDELPAEASIVFLGNTSAPPEVLQRRGHLFADLPEAMVDPAFLDRLHFYLPGWETPKMERRLFTGHYGFVSDYLAEALRGLRRQSQVRAIDEDFLLGSHLSARDEKAVRKTVSGLLKILHPHGVWTRAELREYLELALEGRRRVKEQLRYLAAHDYAKTDFSYIERDTGRETWVQVREQPEHAIEDAIAGTIDNTQDRLQPSADAATRLPRASLAELLERGEGKRVEFKSSARWHYRAGRHDELMEQEVIRTVAGFLNAGGGTLLIGVNDDHEAIGLERDFQAVKGRDRDGFENWLTNRLEATLGKPALHFVEVQWEQKDGHDICRLDVQPSDIPVFVRDTRGEAADLYVRTNNSTRRFNTEEAMRYIQARWRK
jgi:ATP-dependent Lon protease